MVNKNYVKGRKREYKIIEQLKKEGYDIAQRSAGSHSPIDIWAVRSKDKVMKLVQVKPKSWKESERQKILDNNKHLTDVYKVEFEVR